MHAHRHHPIHAARRLDPLIVVAALIAVLAVLALVMS